MTEDRGSPLDDLLFVLLHEDSHQSSPSLGLTTTTATPAHKKTATSPCATWQGMNQEVVLVDVADAVVNAL